MVQPCTLIQTRFMNNIYTCNHHTKRHTCTESIMVGLELSRIGFCHGPPWKEWDIPWPPDLEPGEVTPSRTERPQRQAVFPHDKINIYIVFTSFQVVTSIRSTQCYGNITVSDVYVWLSSFPGTGRWIIVIASRNISYSIILHGVISGGVHQSKELYFYKCFFSQKWIPPTIQGRGTDSLGLPNQIWPISVVLYNCPLFSIRDIWNLPCITKKDYYSKHYIILCHRACCDLCWTQIAGKEKRGTKLLAGSRQEGRRPGGRWTGGRVKRVGIRTQNILKK